MTTEIETIEKTGSTGVSVYDKSFTQKVDEAENYEQLFAPAPEEKQIILFGNPMRYRFNGKSGRIYQEHQEDDINQPKELKMFMCGWQKTLPHDFFKKQFYPNTVWYELLFIDEMNCFSSISFCIERNGVARVDNFSKFMLDMQVRYMSKQLQVHSSEIPLLNGEAAYIEKRYLFFVPFFMKVSSQEKNSTKFGRYYAPKFELTADIPTEKTVEAIFKFFKEQRNIIPDLFTMKPVLE